MDKRAHFKTKVTRRPMAMPAEKTKARTVVPAEGLRHSEANERWRMTKLKVPLRISQQTFQLFRPDSGVAHDAPQHRSPPHRVR
jgi:hypothetical protein